MIQFRSLNHLQICIPTGTEAEARKFYTSIIGLTEIPKPQDLIKNGGLWFQVADIQLHIGTENEINKSKRHPAFEVTDIHAARLHLEKHGIKIKEEIQLPGQIRFSFMDPFNNRIELLQLTGIQQHTHSQKQMQDNYLDSVKKEFRSYKLLGEKAMEQTPNDKLFWQSNPESNSIATIVQHLSGNMLSRWTDFLTTDGEKEWRDRDLEFENNLKDRRQLLDRWEKGWTCFFKTLDSLTANDLDKIVHIRNQEHTVLEAISRQLAHYPYHIGQIILIAKMTADNWTSLTIPKNKSKDYNADKFSQKV